MTTCRNALLLCFVAPTAFAGDIEADRLVELTWENHAFNNRTATLEARVGGERILTLSGERCLQVGGTRWVLTDVQLTSHNPDQNRQHQFGSSLGVTLHHADGTISEIFMVEPQNDNGHTHTMSLSRGLVVPPHARVCFDGWDGSAGLADRAALRFGRVLGYLPED